MRFLILMILGLVTFSFAGPSPRYTVLCDSTVEKKPLIEAVREGVEKFREKGDTLTPAGKPRPVKGIITTVLIPQPAENTLRDSVTLPETSLRSAAASLVIYDLPETPIDSSKLSTIQLSEDSVKIDSSIIDSSLADSSLTVLDSIDSVQNVNDTAYDGDTKISKGDKVGLATWYGPGLYGRKTTSGERLTRNSMTAAHRTLPLGTMVEVTNLKTGKAVIVKVNDRGPHQKHLMIDLAEKAASKIGVTRAGTAKVKVRVIK